MMTRVEVLILVSLACLISLLSIGSCSQDRQPASQADELIVTATSLQSDSGEARERQLPVVILISQQGCEYCELLRQTVLHPMIQTGKLDNRAILREVSLDEGFELIDFSGKRVAGRMFADRYDTGVTPTLLFLDGYGEQLADRIVGISNIEYYEFYLDKAINNAIDSLSTMAERKK